MRTNTVKQKLAAGGVSIGTMVFEFKSTGLPRLAGLAGAEFCVYDMEHSGWTFETIREFVAASGWPTAALPFVRIPTTAYHFVARAMDIGVSGVMVPRVETGAEAELIVKSAKYTPEGERGAAFGFAHDGYEPGAPPAKMRRANAEALLIAQIETQRGLDHLEAIASTVGIDVLWIGHFDLTNSMGIPGEFEHPRFKAAVKAIVDAANRHGKVAAMMVANAAEGRALLAQGFRCLAYSGDLQVYGEALRAGIAAVRE